MAVDVYISTEDLQKRIKELGEQITKDFNGEEVTVVGVLNGAFMFVADLIREMDLPVVMEFIKASSYGDGTESKGSVDITLDLQKDIAGKMFWLLKISLILALL
ncbi:MAG: hypothetical protein KC493_12020 [Bacteriovoracaceae bacterium]|nr:hypothetical protein [Bacteriovoracaceae bacterium]